MLQQVSVTKRFRFISALRGSMLLFLGLSIFLGGCLKEEPQSDKRIPIRVYLKRLRSDNEKTVERAQQAIGTMGRAAVPYIIKKWRKSDLKMRYRLAEAIYNIGPEAEEAVPVLVKALDAIDEQMISSAAKALSGIGPAAAPAVPRLDALMRSSDTSTQVNILRALGAIGPAAAPALPRVMEAVKREKTRTAAIEALSKMGPKSMEVMKQWLDSGDPVLMLVACDVLALAGGDAVEALPLLTQAFKSKNPKVRAAAARAIGRSGMQGMTVAGDLIDALREKDPDARNAIINSLSDLGPDTGPLLINAFTDKNPRVREGAIMVVSRFASVRDGAMSKLIARTSDSDVRVRLAAIKALSGIGTKVIPAMLKQLQSEDVNRRFGAARVLGNLGSKAKSALPELRKLLSDRDSLVKEEAQKAIGKIQE